MCEYSKLDAAALHKLHMAPAKDPTISFTVRLEENNQSSPGNGILAGRDVPSDGTAMKFAVNRYPELQSFKSAYHSQCKEKILLVGGRTAGLHTFHNGTSNFSKVDQNYALFVINVKTNITMAAALPPQLRESLGVMNAQAQQVTNQSDGTNYLFIVGGFGWSSIVIPERNITYSTLSTIRVDDVIDSIENAANSVPPTVPEISRYVSQTQTSPDHDYFKVTGGEMLMLRDPAASSMDTFYLVAGQYFDGNYGGDYQETFRYTRSILSFPVPYPDENGKIPDINPTVMTAFNSSSPPHNKFALDAQLSRRDLNVVSTFLLDDTTNAVLPGALILSGVFQQDGSNAPFLQPIVFSFKKKSFNVAPFFQLYNNYSCANLQLFSSEDVAMYNILLGGVSYFYSSPSGALEQATNLFKIPMTADVSIVKQDKKENFTQILCPKSTEFFSSTKLTTFGTEALFVPDPNLPVNKVGLSDDVYDLDAIRTSAKTSGPVRLGAVFGGIESTQPPIYISNHIFEPSMTKASSRLIDVYITVP